MSDVSTYTPPPAPAETFGQALMQAMTDPAISAEKLAVVLQARREVMEAQAREQFNEAFSRMQLAIPQVTKHGLIELVSKDGRHLGQYRFAKWEDMDQVIRPILAEHGFSLSFSSQDQPDGVLVIGELAYRSYSKTSRIKLPPDQGPGRNPLQAYGGALSYGKRYTAELLLNIVRKGEDTDAVDVSAKKIDTGQRNVLHTMIEDTNTDMKRFLTNMVSGVDKLEDILERDYTRLVNALQEKKKKRDQEWREPR